MTDSDVVTRMLQAIDALDWTTVRASFADMVATDYTSLWGGEPEMVVADDLIVRWIEFASGFAATQHQTGPIVSSDGRAETHVVAHHWLPESQGGDSWTVHGHYVVRVSEGKIAAPTLQTLRATGHAGLPDIAGQRAAGLS